MQLMDVPFLRKFALLVHLGLATLLPESWLLFIHISQTQLYCTQTSSKMMNLTFWFSDICLPAPAPFGVKKATFWGPTTGIPKESTFYDVKNTLYYLFSAIYSKKQLMYCVLSIDLKSIA
jgi:hypothetical protein